MSLTPDDLKKAMADMGLTIETDGSAIVHVTEGRYAPSLQSIITLDDDGAGATVMTSFDETVTPQRAASVCELLNLVHGQSLWNVRFHLDETGRVFSIGKVMLWGRPFNPTQFGDVFFSLLVATDRLYPCLRAITVSGRTPAEGFELFFLKSGSGEVDDDPEAGGAGSS